MRWGTSYCYLLLLFVKDSTIHVAATIIGQFCLWFYLFKRTCVLKVFHLVGNLNRENFTSPLSNSDRADVSASDGGGGGVTGTSSSGCAADVSQAGSNGERGGAVSGDSAEIVTRPSDGAASAPADAMDDADSSQAEVCSAH